MLRKVFGALLLSSVFVFSSCSETIDVNAERRAENEKVFLSYASAKNFEKVSLPGNYGDRYIYMNKKVSGSGTVAPRATDLIKMHYEVALLSTYKSGTPRFFDGNFNRQNVSSMRISDLIPGVAIALQSMKVGDKAEVLIPWFLAYGSRDSQVVPAFSALYYNIELLSIVGDQE